MISGLVKFLLNLFCGIIIIAITFLFSYVALKLMGVSLW